MEHRIGSRRSLILNDELCLAELYLAGRKIAACPVSNIGVTGIGIENSPHQLHSGMFLEVVVKPRSYAAGLYPGMNALVIWTDNDRAGLMWAGQGSQLKEGNSARAA
jgi:hypothetical protein